MGAIRMNSLEYSILPALGNALPRPADPRTWTVALQSAHLGFRSRHICSKYWQMNKQMPQRYYVPAILSLFTAGVAFPYRDFKLTTGYFVPLSDTFFGLRALIRR